MFLFIHVCFKSNIFRTYVWAVFACVLWMRMCMMKWLLLPPYYLVFSTSSILYKWLLEWSPTKIFQHQWLNECHQVAYTGNIYVNKHAIASNHYLGAYKHLNFHIIIILSCAKWFHSKYNIISFFNIFIILLYEYFR